MKILWVALKKNLGLKAKERKDSVSQNLLEGMKGDNRQCVGFPARSMHLHFKEHFFIFPFGESVHWFNVSDPQMSKWTRTEHSPSFWSSTAFL